MNRSSTVLLDPLVALGVGDDDRGDGLVAGGTDGGPTHMLDIPCVVAGVPSRYVHSGTALCTLYDVKMTAEVAVAVAERITPDAVRSF